MYRIISCLALLLALLLQPAPDASAADEFDTRTVSVTGIGKTSARPDTATLSLGVVSEGDTARDALDKNTAAMSRVIVELKGHEVDPKDIQTTSFSVHPRHQHFKDGKPPVIIGYRVVNAVNITIRDLPKLGTILDQAVSHGSNQVNGISFSIDDSVALEDEARRRAMNDARRKAELYAKAGKATLGKVLRITEDFISHAPRPVHARAAMRSEAAAVPLEAGEHKLEARVNVTWELAK